MDPALVTSWQAWAFFAAAAGSVSVALLTWCALRPTHPLRRVRRLALVAAIVGLGITGVNAAMLLAEEMWDWMSQSPGLGDLAMWSLAGALAAAAALLGWWALLTDRSRGRRRCPKCWYDMSGTAGLVCPECGKDAKRERRLFRTRRRKRWAAAALVILGAAVGTGGYPLTRGHHWSEAMPTSLLITVSPWVSNESTLHGVLTGRLLDQSDLSGSDLLPEGQRRRLIRAAGKMIAEPLDEHRAAQGVMLLMWAMPEALQLSKRVQELAESPDSPLSVRKNALFTLLHCEGVNATTLPTFDLALRDPDPVIVRTALVCLLMRSPIPAFSDPPASLIELAGAADRETRRSALKALRGFHANRESDALLAAALMDLDWSVGGAALSAYFFRDVPPAAAIDAARRWLSSGNPDRYSYAAESIASACIARRAVGNPLARDAPGPLQPELISGLLEHIPTTPDAVPVHALVTIASEPIVAPKDRVRLLTILVKSNVRACDAWNAIESMSPGARSEASKLRTNSNPRLRAAEDPDLLKALVELAKSIEKDGGAQ